MCAKNFISLKFARGEFCNKGKGQVMAKLKPFRNEKPLDFSRPSNVKKQRAAIEEVQQQYGKKYPLIIGGKRIFKKEKIASRNPSHTPEVVGLVSKAARSDIDRAMKIAWDAFEQWKRVPAEERASYLLKAAEILRQRRLEINAWMISEVGKNYAEADADTCEAIDFLEYYAREAIKFAQDQPVTRIPTERNRYFYIPLGVGVIIPPWNFPMAILTGMTSAAIVAGNTVLLKPASDSPVMGYLLAEIMHEAGLPDGVLNFVPGSGAEIGDYLVQHPKTRFISFTGSKEVGLRINKLAAQPQPGQIWIKRVIAEMGGKDAIIVDSEADLDAAVQGVLISAYGFQGQKCSACSRAIVDRKVYDEFLERLLAGVEKYYVDDARNNPPVGPVVSAAAEKKILKYIQIGKKEGTLIYGGKKLRIEGKKGYYIQPTIFKDVDPHARIAQEEIFGPVLAVIKAKNYNDALRIANDTEYGLTGSVYSTNQEKLDRAAIEFHVGNLYFNRKCTGALVGVHPFGGFNMSGTDSKAGGPDYLLLYLQGKAVSQKIK